ncbi:hypothetical protein SLEP1_g28223 [Rubroshorea leprosula]|uniref:Uncharacterized protein n=1 Tax=Rubroshorea leprosula TaxID=152421 RepID=A0AAV5JZG1_9ROSI|nr:hypothetical protein SLEP1_g28223 [Rubroshorea leprosula]
MINSMIERSLRKLRVWLIRAAEDRSPPEGLQPHSPGHGVAVTMSYSCVLNPLAFRSASLGWRINGGGGGGGISPSDLYCTAGSTSPSHKLSAMEVVAEGGSSLGHFAWF